MSKEIEPEEREHPHKISLEGLNKLKS